MLILKRTNSSDKDFHSLVEKLDTDLADRYGELQSVYDQYNKIENLSTIVVAYINEKPAGCGCFKFFSENVAEVKRMYVEASQRGNGIGTAILTELEKWATELKFDTIVLETGNNQPEAIHLYQKLGYKIIPNYGQYAGMASSICMKKKVN